MNSTRDRIPQSVKNLKNWIKHRLTYETIAAVCACIFLAEVIPGPWSVVRLYKFIVCGLSLYGMIWCLSRAAAGYRFGEPNESDKISGSDL